LKVENTFYEVFLTAGMALALCNKRASHISSAVGFNPPTFTYPVTYLGRGTYRPTVEGPLM
jgi:hypothetical protein